jgi:hypothetical protein
LRPGTRSWPNPAPGRVRFFGIDDQYRSPPGVRKALRTGNGNGMARWTSSRTSVLPVAVPHAGSQQGHGQRIERHPLGVGAMYQPRVEALPTGLERGNTVDLGAHGVAVGVRRTRPGQHLTRACAADHMKCGRVAAAALARLPPPGCVMRQARREHIPRLLEPDPTHLAPSGRSR